MLEGDRPSQVMGPLVTDSLGHSSAQSMQASQNSVTPKSMGTSGTSGMSVITLARRTLGPYFGVTRRPMRPSWPNPASTAMGMDGPTPFPAGMAR